MVEIKKYLREREIRIYEPTGGDKNTVITVDHDLYNNYYFKIHNKDFGYTTICLESHIYDDPINIKIHEYKKYSMSRSANGNISVIIIKDAKVKYIDKHTIHVL